jgi:hypothetical protein
MFVEHSGVREQLLGFVCVEPRLRSFCALLVDVGPVGFDASAGFLIPPYGSV